MIVCMPRTCGVLLRTLRVLGRGWHWCAEASAALQTEGSGEGDVFSQSPVSPLQTLWGACAVGTVGCAGWAAPPCG